MSDENQLKINIPQDKLEAKYSDFAIVSQSPFGFTFDFGQRLPMGKEVAMVARIAMSPQHAKLFTQLLSQNIQKYEKEFGEIKLPAPKQQEKEEGKIIHFVK
jgi:hypothetical protein